MPFEKGQSGNPSGRPKADSHLRILARQQTDKAVNTLIAALDDDNSRVRVTAAEAILDRGWGKPAQTIGGDPDGAPIGIKAVVEFLRARDAGG